MKFILLCLLSLWGGLAAAQFVERPAEEEYSVRKQYYKDRVADYYNRLNYLERKDELRKSGEGESKLEHKRKVEEYERSRAEYVKNRKAKPPEDPRAFMIELRKNFADREKAQKDYVQRRKDLERMTRSLSHIPADEELDINVRYQEDQELE